MGRADGISDQILNNTLKCTQRAAYTLFRLFFEQVSDDNSRLIERVPIIYGFLPPDESGYVTVAFDRRFIGLIDGQVRGGGTYVLTLDGDFLARLVKGEKLPKVCKFDEGCYGDTTSMRVKSTQDAATELFHLSLNWEDVDAKEDESFSVAYHWSSESGEVGDAITSNVFEKWLIGQREHDYVLTHCYDQFDNEDDLEM